jgi:hypothetical protein
MAILAMEGFEGYGDYIDFNRRHHTDSTSFFSLVTGRDGSGRAIELNFSSAEAWVRHAVSTANYVVGFGFKRDSLQANADIITLLAEDGASEQLVLRQTSDGTLYLDRGSTNLDSNAYGLTVDTWYYIEIDVTFGDGTAGSYDVYVNGQNIMSGTSVDTRNVTGQNCAGVEMQGVSSAGGVFDDLVCIDDSGTDQTSRIGPCFIETVIPNADGTTVNFTPSAGSNWQNVDDGNSPDDDTTYNSSSTVNHKDLYGMAALTGNIGTVYAVLARSMVRGVDAGTRGLKNVARSNVTEVDGTEKFVDQSWIYIDHIYENDPNGGGAWTESAVNAAEFGIKITT